MKMSRILPAALLALGPAFAFAQAAPLATVVVGSRTAGAMAAYEGVVEAVRQTVVAAQVAGAVVALPVKAGDRVKAGQLLARIDARAAEQQAAAAAAQVHAARAAQEAAESEFARQRQLFQKGYISAAALERAEAQHKASKAQAEAQAASATAARTESGHFVVKAPYDGIVAEVPVVLGDMAMPGRALATLYDPAALRVSAAVPESAATRLTEGSAPLVELPTLSNERRTPARWQVLPSADAATHTRIVRFDLPAGTGALPGMSARAWMPAEASATARLTVPGQAIVRRAELTAVYVLAADGKPLLRQVRLGPATGDIVEVLAGLAPGERVALDPQAAARMR